ncbi:MAG: isoprenyl transferase [Smithella sp.]|nr:isoprenyl transferase [Smithella sp.]
MIKIDLDNLPQHIAVIMDGNGRWAQQHTIGRIRGHRKGAQAVRTIIKSCREIGIKHLTLFAFSVENWERPVEEVNALMSLLEEYLTKEINELHKQGIKLSFIGDTKRLNPAIREKLRLAREMTSKNDKMILNLALSYGGRDEIIHAVKKIVSDHAEGKIAVSDITKENFNKYLNTAGMPDPDLLIRTSGEYRISNFLLWQMAYTELYFTKVLWPDFSKDDLFMAIASYQKRERRFGLTSEQLKEENIRTGNRTNV